MKMRKKGTSKTRLLAWMLCVLMLFSLIPPISVQAGSTDTDDATLSDLVCNWGARRITMNVIPLVPEFNETDREFTAALTSNTSYFYVWPETTNPDATFVIE